MAFRVDRMRAGTESQVEHGQRASDDALTVERVRAGDLAAFEAIFRDYWTQLCRYAFCYLESADEAEEAVQTVFDRIWQNHTTWTVGGTIKDYLYLATRNVSFDRLKRERVVRAWREQRIAELESAPRRADSADRFVLDAEMAAAIQRAFAELPPKRRNICELRLWSRLSYAEIARLVRVSPKTVETQIARGLKQLRESLTGLRS